MFQRFASAVILLSFISGVNAGDVISVENDRKISIEMAREHVTCAAFYAVGAKCLEGDEDPTDRASMQQGTLAAIRRANSYTAKYVVDPVNNIILYRSIFDQMADQIKMDCKNLQELIDIHGNQCRFLMSEPLKRVDQIKKEISEKK